MLIAFVGNCQLAALQDCYRLFVCPHTGDETHRISNIEPLTPFGRDILERADVIVDQVFDLEQRVDLDSLTLRGRICRVPVVGAPFLWPFAGSPHPYQEAIHGFEYQPFRAEMGDVYLNRLLAKNVSPEEAEQRYLDADLSKITNLDMLKEITLNRQEARDEKTGYQCSRLIEANFQERQLFLTPYHPTLLIAKYMTLTFFQDFGVPSVSTSLAERFMTTTFYPNFALPVHPGVARHFGLKWANASTRYRFHIEGLISFREFVAKYVRCEANVDLLEAIKSVKQRRPDARKQIEAALARTPDSPEGLLALAEAQMEDGHPEEAVGNLHRAIELDPELDLAHMKLSQCFLKLKRPAESEMALRKEIELRPFRPGLHAHLAHVLASRGAYQEAIASMTTALQLSPGREPYVAALQKWLAASSFI